VDWTEHACVDLIEVSPLVGLRIKAFTVGHATIKVASNKVSKHDKGCYDNQHVFIPFTFDTFGFLTPEVVDLLQRFQRVVRRNIMYHRSINVVFKMIDFFIQKNLTTRLVVRFPSILIFYKILIYMKSLYKYNKLLIIFFRVNYVFGPYKIATL
jgi:hypothetical protein